MGIKNLPKKIKEACNWLKKYWWVILVVLFIPTIFTILRQTGLTCVPCKLFKGFLAFQLKMKNMFPNRPTVRRDVILDEITRIYLQGHIKLGKHYGIYSVKSNFDRHGKQVKKITVNCDTPEDTGPKQRQRKKLTLRQKYQVYKERFQRYRKAKSAKRVFELDRFIPVQIPQTNEQIIVINQD